MGEISDAYLQLAACIEIHFFFFDFMESSWCEMRKRMYPNVS